MLGITAHVHCARRSKRWGWPGITAHVHSAQIHRREFKAGDGRESPLTYTQRKSSAASSKLGMAGNHRSRTLLILHDALRVELGMAGNHRSRTLGCAARHLPGSWGWPGITAHVH